MHIFFKQKRNIKKYNFLRRIFFLNFFFCISNNGYKICSSFFNSLVLEKRKSPRVFLFIEPFSLNNVLTLFENKDEICVLTFFYKKVF